MPVNNFDKKVGGLIFGFFYKDRYSMFDEFLLGIAFVLILLNHPAIGIGCLLVGMIMSVIFKMWVDRRREYGIN